MRHYLTTFPLGQLRSGAEIGIDSRSRGRDDGIEDLAADIRINGLLQPIGVWVDPEGDPDVAYVAFGNRRLAALKFNETFVDHDPAERIPCVDLRCDRSALLALSAVENLSRLALHPVDQFEAFAAMRAAGMSIEAIGDRFGLDGKEVNKRLALGNLASEVREAWVAGSIDKATAAAFAAAPDLEAQVRVLENLPPMNKTARQVTWLLFGDTSKHAGELAFVGRDVYEAVGGRLQEDLFEGGYRVLDPEVLSGLVTSRAAENIERLTASGWKWAAFDVLASEEERHARYSWSRVWPTRSALTDEQNARLEKIEAWCEFGYDDDGAELSATDLENLETEAEAINATVETFTAEQKAGAGVVARIKTDGSLEFAAYVNPADRPKDPSEPRTPREQREATGEPAAVLAMARAAQTRGLAIAISQDPTAAKIALVATMLFTRHGARNGSPVCVRVDGATAVELSEAAVFDSFGDAVAHCRSLSPSALERLLAYVVAQAIDASSVAREPGSWSKGVNDAGVAAIADLVDPDLLAYETHKALSFEAYFDGATKGAALEAIKVLDGEETADRWAKSKKGEIAKHAAFRAANSPWIPPSVRPPRYRLGKPVEPPPKTPQRREMEAQVAAEEPAKRSARKAAAKEL